MCAVALLVFRVVFRNTKFCADLRGVLKESSAHTVDDLMKLDIGPLYKKIEENDKERRLYGFIPLMATCSYGQIGALNAESVCERVLSCANDVMTDGNTVLGDEELEMLVILRMNREFMKYMRENFNHLTKDHFTRTAVNPTEEQLA